MLKQWFINLEKREQRMLVIGAVAVIFYLIYGVMFRGLVDAREKLEKQNAQQQESLEWMRGAAQTIASLKQGGSRIDVSGKSLTQLAEEAARDADVRITRMNPSGDSEAQLWIEREKFSGVLVFVNRMEIDYGFQMLDVSITSANSPDIVNLRLKFAR